MRDVFSVVAVALLTVATLATTRADDAPHAVFLVGTHHYSPQESMPKLAQRLEEYGFRTTVILPEGDPEHLETPKWSHDLSVLSEADVAVFYLRFLTIEEEQFRHIREYVESGKPVVGLRTATHAFDYPDGHALAGWNDGFGRDVLGSRYFLHLQGTTTVEHVLAHRDHPILNGMPAKFLDPGTLYRAELPEDAIPLLTGTGRSKKTGTVTNRFGTHELKREMSWPVAWTWTNKFGGRTFATTLGHANAFDLDPVNRLIVNGIHWTLGKAVNVSAGRLKTEQANRRMNRPVGELGDYDPENERRAFEVLDGFEVNLWAAEPMLVNPIHMTWDPDGRLWVCCSPTYPQVKPGEIPNDQIIVLEDTDNDGQADTSTVFADGLYVPTGLELGDGGVYVANAPDLLFLKDTDGDLKADVREVVLTGFATEDNHHSISAWRWGPGGWLYFQEGTFMHSQVETPHGPVRLENGGIFQFRPRDLKLRVYADYRASNPWGHMFDRWGTDILIDNPRLIFTAPLTANSRAKLAYQESGKGTKQCGGEFVSGRHLPEEYHGQIWTNQYKANTVTRYEVTDDGAGVAIRELEPLIRSHDVNFRPVDLKMGPDGAVYILDWYNPLIGHMQHSFRDERRDTTHGRVWRVTAKGRPLVEKPKLTGVPLEKVIQHLKDPEDWTRHQVRRVLYDAAAGITNPIDNPEHVAIVRRALFARAEIDSFVDRLDRSHPDFAHHQLEALWAKQTINNVDPPLLDAVLQSSDPRARAAAMRVLRDTWEQVRWVFHVPHPDDHAGVAKYNRELRQTVLDRVSAGVADDHPRVRLEAVLAAGFIPDPQSVVIATRVLDKPMDRFIDHALKLTVDGLQEHWLPAHQAGELEFDKPEHKNFALANIVSSESVQVMVDLLNSGEVNVDRLRGPADAVARTATAAQLEKLVLTMVEHTREYGTRGKEATDPVAITTVLDALNRAARTRDVRPTGVDKMLPRCFTVPDPRTQAAAARLVGAWKLGNESGRLQSIVNANDADLELQVAAATAIGEIGGRAQRRFLEQTTGEGQPVRQRYLGAIGLIPIDLREAAIAAAGALSAPPGDAKPQAVVRAFLRRRGGADALAKAMTQTPPHTDVAATIRQHFIEIGETHAGLVKAVGGEVSAGSLEGTLLAADVHALAAEMREQGDPERGEQIFRRADLACMKCHAVGKAGANIGPDLAAIGSSSPPDYLVDSILRPSKVIKEFYETAVVVTAEGEVITGILVLHDDSQVVLRDPSERGAERTIPMSEVEGLAKGPSLMPVGLANKLNNRQEFLDLVRFVSELGRPGPYAASPQQYVRRWRIHGEDGSERPAYSMVDGMLPAGEFGDADVVTIAGQVQVTTAGAVRLEVNSPVGLSATLDRKTAVDLTQTIDLAVGVHTLTLQVDTRQRGSEGVRLEVMPAPGSPAAVQAVGGP